MTDVQCRLNQLRDSLLYIKAHLFTSLRKKSNRLECFPLYDNSAGGEQSQPEKVLLTEWHEKYAIYKSLLCIAGKHE